MHTNTHPSRAITLTQGGWCSHYINEAKDGKVTGGYTSTIDMALFVGGMVYATRCLEKEAGTDLKVRNAGF